MKIDSATKNEIRSFLKQEFEREAEKIIVFSPFYLEAEEKKLIQTIMPEAKKRPFENILDHGILAGIIIKKGSRVLDLSINAKLKKLETDLYETR